MLISRIVQSSQVLLALTFLLMIVHVADVANAADHELIWSSRSDAITLDPQGRLSAVEFTFLRIAYEGLTGVSKDSKIIPGLAERWETRGDTTWRFYLRRGVTFHEGQKFNADDVIFTLKRAMGPNSAFRGLLAAVKDYRKVDEYTVDIDTFKPDPLMLVNLVSIFILDEGWAKQHGVEEAINFNTGKKSYAISHMNGTGPFVLIERKPDVITRFTRNNKWWGWQQFGGNLSGMSIKPITSNATRVAALLSGEVDLILDMPLADIRRVEADPNLKIATKTQFRTIFLGFNLERDNLETTNVKGNPFRDIRVRKAVNLAIDADLIKQKIMRGLSIPTSVLVPPELPGHTPELAKRWPIDLKQAKALLAEAGYPNGFSIRLDCPNNRYINDEAICLAAVSMLSKIGIKVVLNAMPRDQWGPILTSGKTDFYLLGFGTADNDSAFMARNIFFEGPYHSGWKDERVDELLEESYVTLDVTKRQNILEELFRIARDGYAIAPIHNQIIVWAMKTNVDMPVDPNNMADFRYTVINSQ